MRDRKLSDQTLPSNGSRNPSFTFDQNLHSCRGKVTNITRTGAKKSARLSVQETDAPLSSAPIETPILG